MKTQTHSNLNLLKKVRTTVIIAFSLVVTTKAFSQWPLNRKNFFVGVEMTNSSRSFTVTSDQSNLAGKRSVQGKRYAVVFGNRAVTGKFRLTDFTANQKEAPIKSSAYELISNFQPLQFLQDKPRVIEPYFTFSLEAIKLQTSGVYTPPPPLSNSSTGPGGAGSTCTCTCPNSPAAPPAPKAVDDGPVPYSGHIITTRGNAGVGLKIHIEKDHFFFNVFAEMKYGIALGNTSSTQALLNTYSLAQKAVDFGVSMGYVRNKSMHTKTRRLRFR